MKRYLVTFADFHPAIFTAASRREAIKEALKGKQGVRKESVEASRISIEICNLTKFQF